MAVAVLSDVHSNLPALEAVLEAVDALADASGGEPDVEEVVCLGDTVGYAAHPAECLALVRDRCDLVLLGNHDEAVAAGGEAPGFNATAAAGVRHSRKALDREALDYLEGLEPMVRRGDLCLVHASPRDPIREYVFPDANPADLEAIAEAADGAAFVLMGHTHVPMDLTVETDAGDGPVRLLNPGSVGQPRDGDPDASFALIDPDEGTFEVRRVAYDVEAAVRAVEEAGLPAFNGERLREGM